MRKLCLDDPVIAEDMERVFTCADNWEPLDDTCVLITGATGMIGAYLTLFLIYLNEVKGFRIQIAALERSDGALRRLFGDFERHGYFKTICGNASQMPHLPVHPDYMIHAASPAVTRDFRRCPVETILPNVLGTSSLLEHMRENGGNGFLLLSSGAVYGDVETEQESVESHMGDLRYLLPENSYAEGKRCAEALSAAYYNEYCVPAKIARISHAYGPSMNLDSDGRVFADFVRDILQGRDIVLKSDGTEKRPFCYLSDLLSGLFLILLRGEPGVPYNVANTSQYVSIAELAFRLTSLYRDENISVTREDGSRFAEPRFVKGESPCPIICNRLNELGWTPQIDIESGFRRTVEYFRRTSDGTLQ